MALQYSVTLRNSQLDLIESTVGVSALLRLYSGSPPANCAAAATGTLLVEMALPTDWMGAAAAGVKAKAGTWSGNGTVGAGTGTNTGYFRLVDTTGAVTTAQGTVTITGGGGDMTMDNPNVANNQTVTVSSFSITALNA